jgi:hypothetical protein
VEDVHRLSDAEREQAVVFLREHLLAGRLSLDEFSDRVGIVYGARVGQELVAVRADLPQMPVAGLGPRRKPTRLTLALFSHVARRGRLRLRRRTVVAGAFADIDFDLREAEVDRRQTTVFVLTSFSNADVFVPEGVNVDFSGLTIFGHRREWGPDTPRPGWPTIRIRTLGWFTTIDLWRVPPDVGGSYSEIFRQLQGKRRRLLRADASNR